MKEQRLEQSDKVIKRERRWKVNFMHQFLPLQQTSLLFL